MRFLASLGMTSIKRNKVARHKGTYYFVGTFKPCNNITKETVIPNEAKRSEESHLN
jgi:hypothetical protein